MNNTVDDGISIKPSVGINMAWSQFEYDADVDIKILRRDGISLGPTSSVVIRPSTVRYTLKPSRDGGIIVRVPKNSNGRKFSVGFGSDLYTYRSNGSHYASSGGSVVGVEPANALMIFASPFIPSDMIPSVNAENTPTMTPGQINNGDWGSSPILYFPPGVNWMNQDQSGNSPKYGQSHIKLSPNTHGLTLRPELTSKAPSGTTRNRTSTPLGAASSQASTTCIMLTLPPTTRV